MTTYLITSPDGKKYKVTGDGTKEEALAHLQAQLGQSSGDTPEMAARRRQGLRAEPPPFNATPEMAARYRQGLPPEPKAFNPGVEGYDPQTGNVDKMGRVGTFMSSGAEGVPIAGPALDAGVNAVSAGIGSAVTGEPYSKVKSQIEGMREVGNQENPISRVAGNVAGGVVALAPIGATEAGGWALGTRGATTGGRILRSAISSGGINAADTAARGGDTPQVIQSGLVGAGLGAALPVAGDFISSRLDKLANVFKGKSPAPLTPAQLNANKKAAYDLSEKAGVIIKPEGMKSLLDNVKADISEFGYDDVAHPGAKILLKRIEATQGQNVTLKGLDAIRKLAGNVGYIQGNKPNNEVVRRIVGHIDGLIDSEDPNLMAGLDTAVGVKALQVAREYAKRSAKLETVGNLVKKGNQQADSNITDTQVKSVKKQLTKINDPFTGWGRGFTADEKAAAAKAASYTPAQRALHGASVMNPLAGGKLSAAGHLMLGASNLYSGNIPGLALQALGAGAGAGLQKWGQHLAAKSVNEFVDMVARGGVPAPVVKNALARLTASKRAAIVSALQSAGISSIDSVNRKSPVSNWR